MSWRITEKRINVRCPRNGYYLRWYYNGWHYWWFLPGRQIFSTVGEKYRTIGTRKVSMSSGQVTREEAAAIRTILNTIEIYILTDAGWKSVRIERDSVIIYDSKIAGAEIDFIAVIGSRDLSGAGRSPEEYTPPSPPVIMSGFGMLYNDLVIRHPLINYNFGPYYNWWVVKDARGIARSGWHVMTGAEWYDLMIYADPDGLWHTNTAGWVYKEEGVAHWAVGNGLNTYGMNIQGNGHRTTTFGYIEQLIAAHIWVSEPSNVSEACDIGCSNASQTLLVPAPGYSAWMGNSKKYGEAIRLAKDSTTLSNGQTGTYLTNDGLRLLRTVCINGIEYLADNLYETKFSNGDDINVVQDAGAWNALDGDPAMCYYIIPVV